MASDPVTGLPLIGTYQLPTRDREIAVIAAVVERNGLKGAADLRRLSPDTVKTHLQRVYDMTGLTLYGLIYLGGRDGWLPVPRLEEQRLAPEIDSADVYARVRRMLLPG